MSSQPPPEIAPPIAALRGAGRTFDDVVALTGVDLAIERGSIVGVIGPSGAGKTTAIRLLTGALRPTSGEAEVLGADPTRLPAETRARVGFMPQHVSLYDDLTVGENLDFVASLYGLFMFKRRARIRALLDWLELTDARKRRAGDLSGGMRRRLQLACALVHDPELVFLDEPTAGIDPLVRQSIWRELHRLREAGRTLLITTQYVPEAEECDVVALIAEGRLIAFDTPEALRHLAFGGQLLEVETSDPVDVDRLSTHIGVEDVRRLGPRRLQVLSPDSSTIAPAVIAGVEAQGATVTSIHEARPSFDEVFALLVRGSQGSEDERPAGPTDRSGRLERSERRAGAGRRRRRCDRSCASRARPGRRRRPRGTAAARGPPRGPVRARGRRRPRRPRRSRSDEPRPTPAPRPGRRRQGDGRDPPPPERARQRRRRPGADPRPVRPRLPRPAAAARRARDPARLGPLRTSLRHTPSLASDRVDIVGVTPDVATAREQLRAGAADIVVIAPADAQAELSQGRQAVMTVEYDTVSPYRAFIARTAADQLVAAVNSEVIATAAQRVADKAGAGGPEPATRAEPRGRGRADARRGDRPLAERARTSSRSTGSWSSP